MSERQGEIKPKNGLEQYFINVYKEHIRLNIYEQEMNNDIIQQVHLYLLEHLRKNALFDTMYKKTFYGGSYYDGLKVTKPDEYDLMFQLQIPIKKIKVISGRLLGYAQVEIQSKDSKELSIIKPLIGKDNDYLEVSSVNSWFQGIVNKAVIDMKRKNRKSNYKILGVSNSGPAMTLVVENMKQKEISIDFVPGFWFSSENWPVNCIKEPRGMKLGFCIVPKSTKDQIEHNDLNFRLSFHEQERLLIKGQYYLKPAIKLIKYLRDEEMQTPLKSYYIKTVALWELSLFNARDADFTKTGMSNVFLHMLKRLHYFIKDGKIPFYWNPNGLNLISDFSPDFQDNLCNRLAKIIKNIEELNWDQMSNYFNE